MGRRLSRSGENRAKLLTRRQGEILALLAQGYSGPEIAEKLALAISSVRSHLLQIYGKLGVNTKRQALTRAAELGLLGTLAPTAGADSFPSRPAQVRPPNNLPLQLTPFFGREHEISRLKERLARHRLITLTGSGGVGKTRLSLQIAESVWSDFSDGTWFVELAPVSDPELVDQTVAKRIGLRVGAGQPVLNSLSDYLSSRQTLLVLDNCEHVLEAAAQLADALLQACPHVKLLISSREPIGVAGEVVFAVPSLDFPKAGQVFSPERLDDYASVGLFVDRVRLVLPDYQLDGRNAKYVAHICQCLEGIPLALELAAARMNVLSAQQLAGRLDDVLRLLTGGRRTAVPRQKTLRATIDWSYNLLTEAERLLLQRLSVFAAGCTLEAAEAVCAGEDLEVGSVLEGLAALVAKSMVIADRQQDKETRYRLLETVRQFAQEKLGAGGEADGARQRHMAYYLALAESETHGQYSEWWRQMAIEFDNLWAATAWAESAVGETEAALRLSLRANQAWGQGGHWRESVLVCERALALPDAGNYPLLQAQVIHILGRWAENRGDYPTAYMLMTQSLRLVRALGAREQSADMLSWLGRLARDQADAATARLRLEESLALYRQMGDQRGIGRVFSSLGEVAVMQEDTAEAERLLEAALVINRAVGDAESIGRALNTLGQVAQLQGDYERAARLHEEGLAQHLRVRPRGHRVAAVHQGLAEVALAQHKSAAAAKYLREALTMLIETNARPDMGWCLAGLAGVAVLNDEPDRAGRLWGAAEALRTSIGGRHAPASRANREWLMAKARERLGEAAFVAAWVEGARLTLEQAVAFAQESNDG